MTSISANDITFAAGDLQVRGKALVAGATIYVEASDSASITAFGEREYPSPAPLFSDIGDAQEYADGLVSANAAPNGWLVARWPAFRSAAEARTLELSRRITVLRDGEQADYFVEGISIALVGFVRMEYLLSPVPGSTLPGSPVVTVVATTGVSMSLDVSWTEPFDGGEIITGYDVEYQRTGDSAWTAVTHTGTGRTVTITGLEAGGISYRVRVRAENAQGEGPWGQSTGATLQSEPSAPMPVLARGFESLGVSWLEPFDGGATITDYDVEYQRVGFPPWTPVTHTGAGRSVTITGLNDGREYDVRVRATNSIGIGEWSTPVTGQPITTPSVPTNVNYNAGTRTVTWEPPTDNGGSPITNYEVLWTRADHPNEHIDRISSSARSRSHSFSDVTAARVRARNAYYVGAYAS